MVTTIVTATSAWSEVILTAVTAWTLQNIGTNVIYVRLDDGTPVAGEQGMKLSSGESLEGNPNLLGDIWIRSISGTSAVAITQ